MLAVRLGLLLICLNVSLRGEIVPTLVIAMFVLAAIDTVTRLPVSENWKSLLAVQLVEIAMLISIWWLIEGRIESMALDTLRSVPVHIILVTYVAAIAGGGEVVRRVCDGFLQSSSKAQARGLPNAGQYIGWLERFLVVTFVFSENSEAIGFLIAAKTLVRFPEIQQDEKDHFAEYFLVGTLTSVGIALGLASIAKQFV